MEEHNNEGIIGTSMGYIYYVDISKPDEPQMIRLVTRASVGPDQISQVLVDPNNKQVFLSTCGQESDDVKLYTTKEIDQIINWPNVEYSPVVFVIGNTGKYKKHRIVGHENGEIRMLTIDNLKVWIVCRVPLELGEKLTAGCYSP